MLRPRLRQGSCRLCLWESNSLWDIFGELAERRNFARKIQACVNIIVSKDDGLSSLICPNCIYKIELFYDFQTSCKRSDEVQKRYNGVHDVERADCDAVEDVLPATALQCAVSNSHKDAQCPVETIDIKEEPIDDDGELAVDGVNDEQFQDAEVEIEEVVAVTENTLDEGITATEHQEKSKEKEAEGAANGSSLQLTPPRSPSFASEATYSASEAGGSSERDSPERGEEDGEQQQERGRSCGHCSKCHPDPHTCGELDRSCSCRDGAEQQQQKELRPPPPYEYCNRCRFCKRWFQKTAVCRGHEADCAPRYGYAPPQTPASTRCRFCSAQFAKSSSRASHERHCLRRARQASQAIQAPTPAAVAQAPRDGELPPQPKCLQQCRFCRKYFQRVAQRRVHEVECGSRLGYSLAKLQPLVPSVRRACSLCGRVLKTVGGRLRHENYCLRDSAATLTPQSPATDQSLTQRASHELSCTRAPGEPEAKAASQSGGQDVVKCRYCGKGHLKWRSLMTHEYHCRRKAPARDDADGVARPAEAEVTVSDSRRGDGDESASPVGSSASVDVRQGPLNRCMYCHKWLRSKQACQVHEYVCKRDVRIVTVRGRYLCSFCRRGFRKRNLLVIHERSCRRVSVRTDDSAAANPARREDERERQSSPTDSQTALSCVKSTDARDVISPGESERKRTKVDTLLYTPLSNSAKETDIWTCHYCDKVFKYRECLRTHEVKCSAIAAYRYSMPHHRPPRFFTCPLCRKAFKFRRKLQNHWKVCKVRTTVIVESAELNCGVKPARDRSDWSEESVAVGGITAPFGNAPSPGEDGEEWRGWPSGHSQAVEDLLSEEDSNSSMVDSCGLSCKLCKKHFCSRVLLELHTLNECIYQRIRNDHAYAQCESPGVDESTLMRMARVELRRLLLCSCCGSIFTDRQALAEHELSERQRRSRIPTELENPLQSDPEATHLQKRIKLGKVVDESALKLDGGGQRESSCGSEQLTTSNRVDPATVTISENADNRQDSKNCPLLRHILCSSGNEQFVQKVSSAKQIKEEVSIWHQERQQLGSMDGEQRLNNNLVLQECVRNNCNEEQLKVDPGKKVSSVDSGLKQGSQIEIVRPQNQECPPSDHKRQLQNKLPNHSHVLPQQQLEDPKNNCSQTYSEENCREDTKQENQCPKIIQCRDTVLCQGSKKGNLPQGLCNGLDHLS